jgi:hypothetical protein
LRFSIKKSITPNKKNRDLESPDISLENRSTLQKDNKENMEGTAKAANENHTHPNNVESSESRSMPEPIEKLQMHKSPGQKGEEEREVTCHHCNEKLVSDWKEPHWKWNLDKNIKFCTRCYGIKETEYEKLMNHCTICNSKLKFIRYNPKPKWKIRGQVCRKCWDSENSKYKSDKQG